MQAKKPHQSNTIRFNMAAGLGLALNNYLEGFQFTGEEVGAFMVILNLILRAVTKTPIRFF